MLQELQHFHYMPRRTQGAPNPAPLTTVRVNLDEQEAAQLVRLAAANERTPTAEVRFAMRCWLRQNAARNGAASGAPSDPDRA